MRCLECRAKNAAIAQVCTRCGAPVAGQWSGAAGPVRPAADAAGWAAPAAIYAGVAQRPSEPAQDSAVDGAMVAQWAEARRFSTTRLRPGYDIDQVDAFLSAIRDTFLETRKPSLTLEEIRNKQFSTTRLRPGYDEEEVDAFLDEAESRLAAQVSGRREPLAAGPESGAADTAAEPATAGATGETFPKLYAPVRPGAEVPAWLRRVPRGYSWMAWGAVFGGWALVAVGGYFQGLSSPSDRWYFLAGIAPGVLAAVLFGQHIRWSLFFRRPGQASSAMVTACRHGGRMLMLDAPCDGYPSGLKVRLAWWAEPEMLQPGEKVTFYGRRGGLGPLLVSSSAPGGALVGTGGRRPTPLPGEEVPQDVSHQPGGQRAGRRYLRWGPLAIFGLGLVAAVVATLIGTVPALTGHLSGGQLRPGDCLTGSNLGLDTSNAWPDMFAAVPCTSPHLAEVFFAGNAWPKSPAAYPGDNAISDQGYARCLTAFSAYDGIGNLGSSFTIDYIAPYGSDDWGSGDRWLVCLAYESTGQYPGGAPVNYSIKGSQQ